MAKKIKTDDLFDGDLFAKQIQSAKDYSLVLAEIIRTQKELLTVTKQQLKENPIGSAKDVQAMGEQTKSIDKTTNSIKALEKAEKELEKQRLAEIKLQKEREKAFDSFNKQQEKNFDLQKKQNSVYSQSVERLRGLKAQLKELEITGRTNGKLYKALGQEFVVLNGKVRDAEEGVGEFFRNVGNYPQQLKALQKELQGLEPGSAKFNELAARAGVLKDKINDAKDATKAFATESKTQTAKTLFGQIASDLKDADFKGAADKSRQLASVVSSISFKEVANGVKDFGSALLNLGKAVFLNPLTIIAGAILGLGAAIKSVYDGFQFASEAAKEFNESYKGQSENIQQLTKDIRELKKENNLLTGDINEQQKKRLDASDKFKDDYLKITTEQKEKEREIIEKFDKENQRTFVEKNTGVVGEGIFSRRITKNAIEEGREILKIRNDTSEATKTLGEKYLLILKNLGLEEVENEKSKNEQKEKENKKQIEKQIIDWNKYYQDLEQLKINNLEDGIDKDIAQINLDTERAIDAKVDEFKIKDSLVKKGNAEEVAKKKILDAQIIELEKQRVNKIAEINKPKTLKGALDDSGVIELKARQDAREKEKKEAFDFLNSVTSKTIEEINKRKQAEINAKQEEIDKRKSSLQVQQDLAARGLTNTLAFEKEQLAKAEQEKAALAKEQERREKRQVFLKALIANLESAKTQDDVAGAFAKSIAITALAETFAGSFKDGVEGLDGKGTGTSDSNLALLSKGESVVTAKGTNKYSGLATAMNKGNAEKWFMENLQPNVVHNEFDSFVLGKKLDAINKTLQSQEKIKIHWDSHDARVESMVIDGYKKTIKHVRSKPRI